MIRISLGNIGSGKTVCEVREMFLSQNKRLTYSNIKTKIPNQIDINAGMIIKEKIINYKKNKLTGKQEPVYKHELNLDYWKKVSSKPVGISVVLDEAHSIMNARRSQSKINIIISDWISLVRRVLGEDSTGSGDLVLISQLPRRLDAIAREMATQIRYHVCHYYVTCLECELTWLENTEMAERYKECPSCNSISINRHSHTIEVWHFRSMQSYQQWEDGMFSPEKPPFHKHYFITDITKYFPLYNTLQWDNMFSKYYS